MRKLHLVGLTTDRDGLIFTARKGSKSGGYIVPLDEKVLAAIAEAREGANGAPAEVPAVVAEVPKRLRSQSALTPREMQARLRAGRSIEEVAAEAGVDNEWVARFAVPILAEQAQVVELARSLVYAKPRLGESSQPLGASVMLNLADRGIFLPDDVADAGWTAFQLHDSVWMVRFRYRSRGRQQDAQWEIDVPAGRLLARNRHASDLGYVDANRRRRELEPDPESAGDGALVPSAPVRRRRSPAAATTSTPVTRKAVGRPKPTPRPRVAVKAAPTKRAPARPAAAAAKAPAKRSVAPRARPAKAAKAAKPGRPPTPVPAPVAVAAKATPKIKAKAPAKRRPAAKAEPAADGGPGAGSGGVRMAVAQVSTARVAASLASADREPWAGAVRRPSRTARPARTAPAPAPPPPEPPTEPPAVQRRAKERLPNRARREPPAPVVVEFERKERREEPPPVPPFEPRPLPPPGERERAVPPRVRKVSVPRAQPSSDEPPALSIPAPRQPAPRQEPLPVERPKRRRLRSR